jgi:hypothetical protein
MALEIVVGFASNMEEHVDVEDVTSSYYSVINGYEPSSPSLISSSSSTDEPTDDAVEYCQCTASDEEAFLECHDCGSFYEPGSHCPLLCVSAEE